MNKQKSGKWGLDIDATLGVIIQFVCGSRVLTSSQLPGKGCAVETCWFNWKNRHGERGGGKQFNYEPAAPGHSGTRVYTPGCDCVFCGRVAWKSALWLHTRLTKRAHNTSATLQRETDRFGSHSETSNDHRAALSWQTPRRTLTLDWLYVEIYISCLCFKIMCIMKIERAARKTIFVGGCASSFL